MGRIVVMLFVLASCANVFGSVTELNVEKRHYTVRDGLSHQHVFQVYQDRRGMIWVVTAMGLDAFDSHTFRPVIRWDTGTNKQHVQIRGEDNQGYLWVSYLKEGKHKLYRIHIKSRVFTVITKKQPGWPGMIRDLSFDRSGNTYILTSDNKAWVSADWKKWVLIQDQLQPGLSFLHNASQNGIIVLWKTDRMLQQQLVQRWSAAGKLSEKMSTAHHLGSDGGLSWWAEGNLLYHENIHGHRSSISLSGLDQILQEESPGRWIKGGCYLSTDSLMWLNVDGRIALLRMSNNQVKNTFLVPGDQYLQSSHFTMTTDRQQNLWIGNTEGLTILSTLPEVFTRINWTNPTSGKDPTINSCRGITEGYNGNVYLSSGPWIYQWQPAEGRLNRIHSVREISPLMRDRKDGSIWFADLNLYRYHPGSNRVEEFTLNTSKHHYVLNWSMLDLGSRIFLGGDNGIAYFDKLTRQTIPFDGYNGFDELRNADIYHIEAVGEGYWMMTNRGFFMMDASLRVIRRLGSMAQGNNYLPAMDFRHFTKVENGYWLATADGLIWWDPNQSQFRHITTLNGLSSNNLYAVYRDAAGYLWMNSDYGIMQMNIATGKVIVYLQEDGIAHNEGNRIAHYRTADGTIYFGGLNGVTAFHPREFRYAFQSARPFPVEMVSAEVIDASGNRDLLAEYYQQGKLVLHAADRFVSLSIARFDYGISNRTDIEYMLEGMENSWVRTDNPDIHLLGLTTGRYTLKIRQFGQDDTNEDLLLVIPIQVLPPFYLSWWFLTLGITIIGMSTFFSIRWRFARIRQRQLDLEEEVRKRTEKIETDKAIIEKQALELSALNEEKSRFFANVTHEFRTPLSLILGAVRQVYGKKKISSRETGLLDIAQRNIHRLEAMVNDILHLARLETGKIQVNPELMNLRSFLQALIDEYKPAATSKSLHMDCLNELPADKNIWMDSHLLRIILNNLLSNAVKFTPEGGQITLHADMDDTTLSITVRDNGRGIDPLDLPHIFNRFYQSRKPGAAAEGGTGIGLSLVQELCAIMGGTVTASSKPGEGAVFALSFPLDKLAFPDSLITEKQPEVSGRIREVTFQQPHDNQRKHLLIAEDNTDFQQFMQYLLADDYDLSIVSNGRQVMELLGQGLQPDLIITDWMMPEMDGRQLIAELKKSASTAAIPIIMLTARVDASDARDVLQLGLNEYLTKPIDEVLLFKAIKELCTRSALRETSSGADNSASESSLHDHEADLDWLALLHQQVEENLADEFFSVDDLAAKMLMGRSLFYQKVKRLLGLTPNQYILEARLLKARALIEDNPDIPLQKILTRIGLKHKSHFIQVFKKRFGRSPSSYR
jgi:signal transduction histidine kinase/DNA-binding response OmpR family regulator/ligand-binding sensor domain-containing protein